MVDAIPLEEAIGKRLQALRTESGVPQEAIAAEARRLGLRWDRATVAAIELGRRHLPVGELLLLPTILSRVQVWAYEHTDFRGPRHGVEQIQVGRHPVGLADLIPDDDRQVLLAGSTHTAARALRELFARLLGGALVVEGAKPETGKETSAQADRLPPLWCQKMFVAIREHRAKETPPYYEWHPDEDEEFWPSIGRDAAADATRKAAAALGVPPIAVALAARALWNAGVTGKREHRLAVQFPDIAHERDWQLRDEEEGGR
jgi:transcriptional regulator with XRE-family HTH domain